MATSFDPHVAATTIEKLQAGRRESMRDELAVEEPLEIRVDGRPLAVTMRTPGEDEDLAVGFLAGEGLIAGPEDVDSARPAAALAANVVEVKTTRGLRRDPAGERTFHLTSSCGVCGKAALEHVRIAVPEPPPAPARAPLDPAVIAAAPGATRGEQDAFDRTGALHATGLFPAATGGLRVGREDVGRHNAMDKAIGAELLAG